MPILLKHVVALAAFIGCMAVSSPSQTTLPTVELKRLPEGGIQPQVAVADDGTVNLVYFKGDPAGGDLFYIRSRNGSPFSSPIRVNSNVGTAIAIGNIRGPRVAVGRQGAVYVVWNGSQNAARANGGRTPMLFTRYDQRRKIFEPERNVIDPGYGLDGGGGVAADREGRVFVFWHAPASRAEDEESRRVWMARSRDDGRTFEAARIAWTEPTGVCGCCSLNAAIDRAGRVFIVFRSATKMVHRDIYLLKSEDHGDTFKGLNISPWNVGYCVMSSEVFASGSDGMWAAWETEKQVHFGRITEGGTVTETYLRSGNNQKYPSLAKSQAGFTLVSWTEDMAWKRGGSLHWQLFESSGHSVGDAGTAAGVPSWSVVACYPKEDGNFVIFY